jgi:hypothetical protein
MQNVDRVVAQPVENSEWIANDRSYADLRALQDARSGSGGMANAGAPIASAIAGLALAL